MTDAAVMIAQLRASLAAYEAAETTAGNRLILASVCGMALVTDGDKVRLGHALSTQTLSGADVQAMRRWNRMEAVHSANVRVMPTRLADVCRLNAQALRRGLEAMAAVR